MNVLIPMAGLGQRFQAAGYDKPKPLIDVFGRPMIERVIDSLRGSDINYIFVAQQQHAEMGLEDFLNPVGSVVWLSELTEGAACTTLLAKEYINNDEELVIANCDQYMEWNFEDFLSHSKEFDGCLATFNSTNPHHSYAKTKGNLVTEVAEKIVISDKASAGIYYFKNGSQYGVYFKHGMTGGNDDYISFKTIIDLDSDDYVQLFVKINNGNGERKVFGDSAGTQHQTAFGGFRITGV